jgi:TDG/mug DNA glycosylase family protein
VSYAYREEVPPTSGRHPTWTRAELESCRGGTLPDLLGPDVRLLFVGINPGLRTVASQSHFSGPGNRFYPALYVAGITDHLIGAAGGIRPADVAHLQERGIGITNLVAQATARADEVDAAALTAGAEALRDRAARLQPAVVAILGITAYRIGFGLPRATVGRQPATIGSAQLWVAPNPSGLNAHVTVAGLAAAYREIAVAAGLALSPVASTQ